MSTDLRSQLLAIRTARGELTPRTVLAEATREDHPLHDHFEWNDEVAGHKYRLDQARSLIRSVRVTYKPHDEMGQPETGRAFISVPRPTGRSYEPVEEVAENAFLTQLALQEMERDWRTLQRRWGRFEEFSRLVRADIA